VSAGYRVLGSYGSFGSGAVRAQNFDSH
jgi:hypothetical protein